jgi:hypothetical protein
LLDEYKFDLSAENSLCADYVSKKFYRALKTDILPVVYGGADDAAYAPPHSYIHVADFSSPKQLAEYLLLLDKNEGLYLKYFEWKKDYDVLRGPLDGWCDLCAKLNDPQEPAKVYESIWPSGGTTTGPAIPANLLLKLFSIIFSNYFVCFKFVYANFVFLILK